MTDDVMRKMDQITDFSYSWETIDDYIVYLHRIIEQVRVIALLRHGSHEATRMPFVLSPTVALLTALQ